MNLWKHRKYFSSSQSFAPGDESAKYCSDLSLCLDLPISLLKELIAETHVGDLSIL